MPLRLLQKRRHTEPTGDQSQPGAPLYSALETVLAYHGATKHYPYRSARSLGYMDWDTQPDHFRRYAGARMLSLDQVPPTPEPAYDAIFQQGAVPPQSLDREFISQLFYDSLALSAWKEYGDSRWSLRVNPSSGNLHPTEGYLLAGPIPGLMEMPALCHYAPFEHGLEVRRELPVELWQEVAGQLPPGALLVGLTSIYWRESWKYGERAFRYCMHDVGHAIAAVAIAAAVMGWEARLIERITDRELAILLSVNRQEGIEAEHPDCLLALYPRARSGGFSRSRSDTNAVATTNVGDFRLPPALLDAFASIPLAGQPNTLSAEHHDWPIIDTVSEATQCHELPDDPWPRPVRVPPPSTLDPPPPVPARQIIRQRRSAVEMDGVTSISREAFYRIVERLLPGQLPFTTLSWKPSIHLAIFVHRVRDLAPGLYFLVRDLAEHAALQAEMTPGFAWQQPESCPETLPLYLLQAGDHRQAAQGVSCGQEIASDGAYAVGMIAEYAVSLEQHGPWFYRRLHWEAGAIGQMLYLEAEAAGVRGTGIGCFFDDSMHQLLGLPGYRIRSADGPSIRYQTLYHFTVGGPIEDTRLRTAPAYGHRG